MRHDPARDVTPTWQTIELHSARAWRRQEGAALELVVEGHMELALANWAQPIFDRCVRDRGVVVVFHDWLLAPTYDAAYRESWQRWLSQRRSLRQVHFLTRSTLLRMGIATANLSFPGLPFVLHTDMVSYSTQRAAHMSPASPPRVPAQ